MAFVRIMAKKGRQYRALVENYREGRKVRQRVLKWLGPVGGYRRFRKHTPAYDVQGAFMLGLPVRIVYDLVTGNRIEQLEEKLANPYRWRMTADDRRGWRPPTLEAALAKSREVERKAWGREIARVRYPQEIEKDRELRHALKEFSASLKSARYTVPPPDARYTAMRDLNQRQWAGYNAKIDAEVQRTHAGNKQHAIEHNLNAPQYGIVAASPSPDGEQCNNSNEPDN